MILAFDANLEARFFQNVSNLFLLELCQRLIVPRGLLYKKNLPGSVRDNCTVIATKVMRIKHSISSMCCNICCCINQTLKIRAVECA